MILLYWMTIRGSFIYVVIHNTLTKMYAHTHNLRAHRYITIIIKVKEAVTLAGFVERLHGKGWREKRKEETELILF